MHEDADDIDIAAGGRVVAGAWEDHGATLIPPFRCRWFWSWTEWAPGRLAGYFAGYEGGGAFVEARFTATFRRARLLEFVWNGRDHVTGTERPDEPPEPLARCCDAHFDVFIDWHDRDRWDDGFLCLAAGRERGLTMLPDKLLLPPRGPANAMKRIGAMTRRTGIMSRF